MSIDTEVFHRMSVPSINKRKNVSKILGENIS